jgi:hypothetical protein
VQLAEGARETILYQIVGGRHITGKGAGIAPEAWDLGLDVPIDVGHENSPMTGIDRAADLECEESIGAL